MAIEKIKLKNFTVFEDIDIDFCKGINVLIGENGTGKTHLLKMLYFFTYDLGEDKGLANVRALFGIDLNIIRNMYNYNDNGIVEFSCIIDGKEKPLRIEVPKDPDVIFTRFGPSITPKLWHENKNKPDSIFIPATEMLSHSRGLLALDRERNIPFDKTLIDIVAKAEIGESKKITEFQKSLLLTISKIIDGEVVYENDTFYVLKNDGLRIEFSMEAEGLRKFGLLWKLIRNGLIEKDTILFWDEPEANINPQLIPDIVEILLELQRNGVQIFLATHDYNLAKYFEVKQKKGDKVVFHSLLKTKNGVQCAKAKNYKSIVNNPIEKANEQLYEDILNSALKR